jgi:hypothetical protein
MKRYRYIRIQSSSIISDHLGKTLDKIREVGYNPLVKFGYNFQIKITKGLKYGKICRTYIREL